MVDPARHTGLPEGTLGDVSEMSLDKKDVIQTWTNVYYIVGMTDRRGR